MVLDDRDVHLWVIRLAPSEGTLERCRNWLAPDERDRAARFHFEQHRRAYTLGRGALRALIGGYTSQTPEQVRFRYGEKGKPELAADARLRFNVSNSGELAACAFTNNCEIGVDIERIRPMHDLEAVARRFFAPGEIADLMALSAENRATGFFNGWTRKEAYIKAVGDGLNVPLASFCVTLRPGDAPRMVRLNGSEDAAHDWTVHAFDPAPGYAGAIAYPEQPRKLAAQPLVTMDELLNKLRL